LACFAIGVFAQIRPHISETFEGEGYSHIVTVNETIWGLGHWVIDEPKGHAIEFWEYTAEHRHRTVHLLKRFDLGFEYVIFHTRDHHQQCHKFAVKPPMPPVWAWTRDSHYAGKHVRDGTTFDWWRHHQHGVELEVAVSEHDASRPHYYIARTPNEHRLYHLISWATFQPNATWFNVPDVCKNATEETLSVNEVIFAHVSEGSMGSDDTISQSCAVAASSAARIVSESNGYDASSLVFDSFSRASINTPSGLWELQSGGTDCVEGARVGDVFFDGLPATSAAVYLGDDKFAECTARGGPCAIVEQRDFTGGCRRYC